MNDAAGSSSAIPVPDDTDRMSIGSHGDGNDDDDDPVVASFPVYYTPHYLNSLVLLQHLDKLPRRAGTSAAAHPLLPPSLRPRSGSSSSRDSDSDEEGGGRRKKAQITARLKPQSRHLEIFVPVETAPARWNEEAAARYGPGFKESFVQDQASAAAGKGKGKQAIQQYQEPSKEDEMKKICYASTEVPDAAHYCVGVFKDGALHMNPVTNTYQMRPHLSYLDALLAAERAEKATASRRQAKDADSSSEDEGPEPKPKKEDAKRAVQVSIKRSEGAPGARGGGGGGAFGRGAGGTGRAGVELFDPLRAKEAEPWVELQHCAPDTKTANDAFGNMFVKDDKATVDLISTTKPLSYLYSI